MSTAPLRAVEVLLHEAVGRVFPAASFASFRGATVYEAAFGAATLETWFDLASLTKALCTSVLCMQKVHAGVLRLDEEVLPGVTVAHLLSHSSGLPAWLPLHLPEHPGAGAIRDMASAPSLQTREAVFRAAAAAPRSPAGERAVYSDLGFVLLAQLLEARGGERLDVQFARIAAALELPLGFRPLDAPETAHPVPASACAPTRRESPDRPLLQGQVHDDNCRAMLGVSGQAGLFGTVAGVVGLSQALLDCFHDAGSPRQQALGLPSGIVRRFWQRHPLTQADESRPPSTWGLGWDHPDPLPQWQTLDGVPSTSSAGRLWSREGVGHLGFTGCSLWLDPATRSGVVLLSNRVCVETQQQAERAQAEIKSLRPAVHDAVMRAWQAEGTPSTRS